MPLSLLRKFRETFSKNDIKIQDLIVSFSRSSGPGGQNVNKLSTKVDMRIPLKSVNWLPEQVKELVKKEVFS